MRIVELGTAHRDVIMLLHGGGLSWWNFRDAAAALAERYHVLLPVLNGHADSEAAFSTIECNASSLLSYIDACCGGKILAIGGLSLGGQIAAEMLAARPDFCKYAILESVAVIPDSMTGALIAPVYSVSFGLIKQNWFARLQFSYLRMPKPLFPEYYRDTCRICKDDMIAFLKASCAYEAKSTLSRTKARTLVVCGSREQRRIRNSAKLLQQTIPDSCLWIMDGYHHGELSLNHPQQYAEMMTKWLEDGR